MSFQKNLATNYSTSPNLEHLLLSCPVLGESALVVHLWFTLSGILFLGSSSVFEVIAPLRTTKITVEVRNLPSALDHPIHDPKNL